MNFVCSVILLFNLFNYSALNLFVTVAVIVTVIFIFQICIKFEIYTCW